MTPETLLACMPYAGQTRAALFAPFLTDTMERFGIRSTRSQAAFLANVCHESGSLVYVREIHSGSSYEGRKDLGNFQPGDGQRFPGRGLAQVTGRLNYLRCGAELGLDLANAPDLLEQPRYASDSAGWFWKANGLSVHGDQDHIYTVCRLWNGGTNGMDERLIHWARIRKVFGL